MNNSDSWSVDGIEYRLYHAYVRGIEGFILVRGRIDEDGDWFDTKETFYFSRDEALNTIPGLCQQETLGI